MFFLKSTILELLSQLSCFPYFHTNGPVNFATVSQTGQFGCPVFLICLLHCNSWPPPTVNSSCQTRRFAEFGYVTKACIEITVKFPFFFFFLMNCRPFLARQHHCPLSSSAFTWCALRFFLILTREPRRRHGCCLTYLRASVCCLRVISGEGRTIHAECGAAVKCFIYRALMR